LLKLIEEGTVKYITASGIIRWRHLQGIMGDVKLVKRIIDLFPVGVGTKARLKNRQRDEIIKDLQKLS